MPHSPIGYRSDIDGLRALAVLAVILFHIDARWLPGGFVGVDVFFVISGYLITGILAKDLALGRFSLKEFYERRIRRILPALWVLMLVCLPISFWLLLPKDAVAAGKSALWSLVALANVFFWREVSTDYFSPDSAQMPFLHLWSLGVEEQFYVFWPLLMLAILGGAVSVRRRWLGVACALVVAVASFAFAEHLLQLRELRFAYYMLPARAGELALGAALALATRERGLPASWAAPLAALGWLLLLPSLVLLSEHQPFPGWHALPPTLGALLLIAAGCANSASAWLWPLRLPASLWLGRCSYSAYLWHWPLLAWWRYLWGQPGTVAGLGLLVLMLVAARLSQRFVEDPARRQAGSFARTVTRFLLLPLLLLGAMALLMARGVNWGLPLYPEVQRQVWASLARDSAPPHRQSWVCQRHVMQAEDLSDPQCAWGEPGQWLLMGDSFAGQYAPVLRPLAESAQVGLRSIALGACAPLPGSLQGLVSDARLQACHDGVPMMLREAEHYRGLIVGANWAQYESNDARTLERLHEWLKTRTAAGQRILLLTAVPAVRGYDVDCVAKQQRVGRLLDCPRELAADPKVARFNARLAELAASVPGVQLLDIGAGLCPEGTRCPMFDDAGRALYTDPTHLSVHGGATLAARLQSQGRNPFLAKP